MIDLPALTSKQHIDAPESKPNPGTSDLAHAGSKRLIKRFALGSLIPTRTALQADLAGPLNTDSVPVDEVADELFSAPPASELFSQNILQHDFVET